MPYPLLSLVIVTALAATAKETPARERDAVSSSEAPGSESAGPASLVAPEDKAVVVFVRPSSFAKRVSFYVFDQDKDMLTYLQGKQHAVISVEPGTQTFYVVSENADIVRADLAAGRTYVIHADAKAADAKAHVALQPALRDSPGFAESVDWIRATRRAEPDPARAERLKRKVRANVVNQHISAAEAAWAEMDEEKQAAMTLEPEDGRTAEEAGKL